MMKNKKFLVVCSGMKIPVDEDELVKVYEALTTGDTKILKQGWFNPSFFIGVQLDKDTMEKFREDNKYDIRDGVVDAYPIYTDLFPDLRERVKQLTASKEVKQLK